MKIRLRRPSADVSPGEATPLTSRGAGALLGRRVSHRRLLRAAAAVGAGSLGLMFGPQRAQASYITGPPDRVDTALEVEGRLTVKATGSAFSAGYDADTTVTFGSGGSPSLPRQVRLVLDAPHGADKPGSAYVQYQRNGGAVTGWRVGQRNATGGASSDVSDFVWEETSAVNKRLALTIAGILRGYGLASTNGDARFTQVFYDATATAAGVGAGVVFGGFTDGSALTALGGIKAIKENGTPGNTAGALVLQSRPNGGNLTDRLRIDSSGNIGVGTSIPQARLHLGGGHLQIGSRKVADGDGCFYAP